MKPDPDLEPMVYRACWILGLCTFNPAVAVVGSQGGERYHTLPTVDDYFIIIKRGLCID